MGEGGGVDLDRPLDPHANQALSSVWDHDQASALNKYGQAGEFCFFLFFVFCGAYVQGEEGGRGALGPFGIVVYFLQIVWCVIVHINFLLIIWHL